MEEQENKDKDTLHSVVEQLDLVWRKKLSVIRFTIAATLFAIGISLLLPKYYIATTTILPDLDFLSSLKGRLGGLQDLAGDLGLGGGIGMSPSQLYPEIIISETILRRVIYHKYQTKKFDSSVTLIQYLEYDDQDENKNFEGCLKRMRENVLTVAVDRKTTIISVTAEITEPGLAADISNQITAELDYYQRSFRNSNAREQRKFLESRLTEVKNDLKESEESLISFREKNRMISQAPQLVLEQSRLERDVNINNAIFLQLKKQYEIVKLDEVKNTPVVLVLDSARAPFKKERPRRIMIVVTVFLLSFFGSIAWFLLQKRINDLETINPNFAEFKIFIVKRITEIPLLRLLVKSHS